MRFHSGSVAARSAVVSCLALAFSTQAQQPGARPIADPAQAAARQPAAKPDQFVSGALNVVQMIDAQQADEVWDRGSSVMKAAVTRDAFVKRAGDARMRLGEPVGRDWIAIARQIGGSNTKLPSGEYVSVTFASTFAKGHAREIVSFRLDQDDRWRVTGYALN